MKRWFQPFGLHTRSFTNSFVCNFLSSSAGINLCSCFSRLTLALCFRFRLSLGFRFHGLLPLPLLFLTSAVFALFRPLQFWILTTQPLFLLFPLLPNSASQWLPQCAAFAFALADSPFFPAWFPVHSFPVPVLSLAVCFLSPFPDSLPQLFLRCLPSALASGIFRSASVSLSVPSASLPATQPSASSFLPSGRSASQLALRPGSVPYVPFASPLHPRLVSRPLPFRFAYSAFCSFPFVLPCFAPTAVPQVLPFWISPPGSVPDFHFLSSASIVASHYSASVSSFPLSSRFRLTVGFLGASVPLTLSRSFPLRPAWFPMPSFRFRVLGFLFVSFRPPQLRSHSCSTGASLLDFSSGINAWPPRSFVRFRFSISLLGLCFFFSPLPVSPSQLGSAVHSGSFRPLCFPLLFRLFPCFPSGSGTLPSCYSFLRSTVSRHRRYFQLPASCFQLGRSPLLSL